MTADYSSLFLDVDPSTTILTPNRRLAVILQQQYQDHQFENQHEVWQTPDIIPITTWIDRCWKLHTRLSLDKHPLLLNAIQERILWEDIILSSHIDNPLLQVNETVDIAQSAWSLLTQWSVDIHHPLFESQSDYATFKQWYLAFQQKCDSNNWVSNAKLFQLVSEIIKNKSISVPQKLCLVGFSEITPALQQLLEVCEQSHIKVIRHDIDKKSNTSHSIEFETGETELLNMALWAKKTHLEFPTQRLACIIPTLTQQRDLVAQVFQEVFCDQQTTINISAGKALLEYPLINHAIQFLSTSTDYIKFDQLALLLASPFVGEAESERHRRGQLNAELRDKNIQDIKLQYLADAPNNPIREIIAKNCPKLMQRLTLFTAEADTASSQTYSHWAGHFSDLLAILGWPGEKTLNSEEYQIVEHWLSVLDEFRSLDAIHGKTSFMSALHTLKKMAKQHVFQAKSPESNIQVLGILEAAGSPFDQMWVSGMNDSTWPPQAKPNPLIPKPLQREFNMPHSSSERELIYCINMTKQLQQASSMTIFSYAKTTNELETNISPIIKHISPLPVSLLQLPNYVDPTLLIYQSQQTEYVSDRIAPPVQHDGHLAGGIDVIKLQAECPFKAFAKHRLHTKPPEDTQAGLRPKERGTVLHATLEHIWRQIKTQASLLEKNDDELSTIIDEAIEMAFIKISPLFPKQETLIALEKSRLKQLSRQWLEIEKQRPPFEVHFTEEKTHISLNDISFEMRIDRIDKISDDQLLILDYKSGKNNSTHFWFGERPDDPQLPLYAMHDATRTVGIAFAQINTTDSKFIGLSRTDLNIAGIKPLSKMKGYEHLSWEDQIEQWRTELERLSLAYLEGFANVDPKNNDETCDRCNFQGLCRINEETYSV